MWILYVLNVSITNMLSVVGMKAKCALSQLAYITHNKELLSPTVGSVTLAKFMQICRAVITGVCCLKTSVTRAITGMCHMQ